MGDEINWLVTVLYGGTLLRCALQIKRDALPGDCAELPMKPENRKVIHGLLPLHVQTCGPIVAVEELFEVHVYNKTPAFPTEHAREAHAPDGAGAAGRGGETVTEKAESVCRISIERADDLPVINVECSTCGNYEPGADNGEAVVCRTCHRSDGALLNWTPKGGGE